MVVSEKFSEKSKTQDISLESLSYISFRRVSDPKFGLINHYIKLLDKYDLSSAFFLEEIDNILTKKGYNSLDIIATKLESGNIYIYFSNGDSYILNLKDFRKSYLGHILKGHTKEEVEIRVKNIQDAIESIFDDNEGIFWNDNLDDNDIVKSGKYGKDLQGKTLKELKLLLDEENKKLIKVYQITRETHKYLKLLKNELTHYAGIGDKYEGGARYFAMSKEDIDKKVIFLSRKMTIYELIEYIKQNNKKISKNYKKSEMVNQVNKKLMNSLTEMVLTRLISENASNRDFIDFAKALTGRGDIGSIHKKKNLEKLAKSGDLYEMTGLTKESIGKEKDSDFSYKKLDIDEDYMMIDFANKTLIYVMYRKGGILDQLKDKRKKEVKVSDEEIGNKTPMTVIQESINAFGKIHPDNKNYGKEIFEIAGFGNLYNTKKTYQELSFDEKVQIGTIARLTKIINNSSREEILKQGFLQSKLFTIFEETFNDLNEDFSKAFGGKFWEINGLSAKDLGLSGDFGEIYELYKDINGIGIFNLSDKTKNSLMGIQTATILGISLIAGMIIIGPYLVPGAAVSATGLFVSGAKLGAVSSITSAVIQKQGYDTWQEGTLDISSQILVDMVLSGAFTASGLMTLKYIGNINPDLILSLPAWTTKAGLVDKGFILGETSVTGILASPLATYYVQKLYKENHFDTDKKSGQINKKHYKTINYN